MKKILFGILIILSACTSGKRSLQKGNYEEAIFKAISRLRNSPGNKNASQTLRDGYPLTLEYHMNNIRNLQNSNQAFHYERVLDSYLKLNQIYEEIQRCPACKNIIPNAKVFYDEPNEIRHLAAQERYAAGDAAFKRDNTRNSAKDAYFHFIRVADLEPDFPDIQQRISDAKFAATLKVVFEQIPVHSRTYQLSNEFFQNQVNQFVSSERMNEFVRFYTPDEARATNLQRPDQIVRMQFDDFVVGQVLMKENTETIQRDSVIVGQVKVENVNKNVYGTVKAKYTLFQKTINSQGLMDLQIIDPNVNRVIYQEKMPGQFVWQSQWATFQGDERALNATQLKTCQTKEVPPPPPQQLFIEFCKPIYTQATGSLRRFYRNY
jgi:hypothetical protein